MVRDLSTPTGLLARAEVKNGVDVARTTLFSAWQQGVIATHYFGHGGVEQRADEYLLASADVPTLGTARPTVVFSWACETQWFMSLWGPAINEALVLQPNGGALASFGPAGITAPFAQRGLYEAVYKNLGKPNPATLGELIRLSKTEALRKDARSRRVIDGWNLSAIRRCAFPRLGQADRTDKRYKEELGKGAETATVLVGEDPCSLEVDPGIVTSRRRVVLAAVALQGATARRS